MSKDLDKAFVDVRNAFRLLDQYQERVLQIVSYIREQTPYNDMWGARWYFNKIGKRRDSPDSEYADISVYKDMWGWDFLYGYIFEYYFGLNKFSHKKAEFSIFQISDDGYFLSNQDNKHMTKVASFAPAEKSHSYLLFNVSVFSRDCHLWLCDPEFPNDTSYDFLTKFLASSLDTKIVHNEKGEVNILKKYEMQRFSSQQSADDVIKDYGKLVKDQANIELFKKDFYL